MCVLPQCVAVIYDRFTHRNVIIVWNSLPKHNLVLCCHDPRKLVPLTPHRNTMLGLFHRNTLFYGNCVISRRHAMFLLYFEPRRIQPLIKEWRLFNIKYCISITNTYVVTRRCLHAVSTIKHSCFIRCVAFGDLDTSLK